MKTRQLMRFQDNILGLQCRECCPPGIKSESHRACQAVEEILASRKGSEEPASYVSFPVPAMPLREEMYGNY